jgi:hypothetical protein
MRKRELKLSLVLPVVQVAIAAALLEWAYRATYPRGVELYVPTGRLICLGLNAPARLFRFADPTQWESTPAWVPRSLFGFSTDDLFLLAGVAVVWFLVGLALDHRHDLDTMGGRKKALGLVVSPLLLALGGLLFYGALRELGPNNNNVNAPIGGILTLMWALSLIFFPGKWLVNAIFRADRGLDSSSLPLP